MHTWKDKTKTKNETNNIKHQQKTTEKEKQPHLKLISTLGTSPKPTALPLYHHKFQPQCLLQNLPQRKPPITKIIPRSRLRNHLQMIPLTRRVTRHCLHQSRLQGLASLLNHPRHHRKVQLSRQFPSGIYVNRAMDPNWRWKSRHNTVRCAIVLKRLKRSERHNRPVFRFTRQTTMYVQSLKFRRLKRSEKN